ncbi:helix-turn-helix domain-containing protein [Mucilaginibacter ginsenosidivorans]|uniref:Helix-turn-helix transcriptional regulator n=1 Tax=Mucilaginibacter ginsenosidivorans TaxID=398053 RepID=A0A5B8UTE9_9SPHI|nr:helix-turn-helix transcriptional regulator [Mucilaginibacter ginsenosidivorans]QEC61736.1 helix-turn-helix transcriptional regulator [Mucilaginibacter ginsenosidivorans]
MTQQKYPNNLRRFRLRRKLTQQEVIVELGHKTARRLSAWEQGISVPSMEHLFALAHLYKVKVEELYGPYKRKLDYARRKRKQTEAKIPATITPDQEDESIEVLLDRLAEILVEAYFYEKSLT